MSHSTTPTIIMYTLQAFEGRRNGQIIVPANTAVELVHDSHWFWWTVRNPATNDVGFIPADILEFDWEREARLNSLNNTCIPHSSIAENQKPSNGKPKKSVRFNVQFCDELSELKSSIMNTIDFLESRDAATPSFTLDDNQDIITSTPVSV